MAKSCPKCGMYKVSTLRAVTAITALGGGSCLFWVFLLIFPPLGIIIAAASVISLAVLPFTGKMGYWCANCHYSWREPRK